MKRVGGVKVCLKNNGPLSKSENSFFTSFEYMPSTLGFAAVVADVH